MRRKKEASLRGGGAKEGRQKLKKAAESERGRVGLPEIAAGAD